MNNKRNGAIDLLKFLFGIMIVFYHGRIFSESERMIFGAGYIAVEFFFLVSGYLMTAKAYSVSKRENILTGKETTDFILKKVKTMLPHILFAYVVCVIVQFCITSNPLKFTKLVVHTVWEPLMLWMSGVGTNDLQINAQTWYISAMLLSMLVMYPIMIRKFDLFTHVVAPAAAIFLFGWIAQKHGSLNHYRGWAGITYSGNLRAIANLSLGSVCWVFAQKLQDVQFSKLGRTVLTIAEVSCYLLVVIGANYPDEKMMGFVMAALLAVGITITFSKTSYLNSCFDCTICYWLGNFSLTIYLNHIIIRKIFQKYDLGLSYKKELIIFIGVVLVWSLIAHFIMMVLLKQGSKLGTKLKIALIETEEDVVCK